MCLSAWLTSNPVVLPQAATGRSRDVSARPRQPRRRQRSAHPPALHPGQLQNAHRPAGRRAICRHHTLPMQWTSTRSQQLSHGCPAVPALAAFSTAGRSPTRSPTACWMTATLQVAIPAPPSATPRQVPAAKGYPKSGLTPAVISMLIFDSTGEHPWGYVAYFTFAALVLVSTRPHALLRHCAPACAGMLRRCPVCLRRSGSQPRGTPPQQSPQPARVLPGRAAGGQQDQVLFAVMSLLPLLGPEHLRVVTSEVCVLAEAATRFVSTPVSVSMTAALWDH